MHSLKNMVVAILLLGVSYGVYEVITTPDSTLEIDDSLIGSLDISEGGPLSSAQPNIQPPEPLSNPPASAMTDPGISRIPAKVASSDRSKLLPPSAVMEGENIIRRPDMDFSSGDESENQLASGVDLESTPDDQELIDALKDHLDVEIETDEVAPQSMEAEQPVRVQLPESETATAEFEEPVSTRPDIDISEAWIEVEQLVKEKQFRPALALLTQFYHHPSLTALQTQKLHAWLDALAGKVIYSMEHHLVEPHITQPGDSIVDIADQWKVTPQLIYNINRGSIPNPAELTPNTELKAVTGPFHAEVNTKKKLLTVFVDKLYAGRFPIEVTHLNDFKPANYRMTSKSNQPAITRNGEPGAYWMGIEGGYCLHAMNEGEPVNRKCVGLSQKDAADLFSIFTEQSQIIIR